MSDEDWSLKGLKQKQIDLVDRSYDIPYNVYRATAIETLRKKLIDDLKIHEKWIPIDNSDGLFETIINKRFGVDIE